jgi:signal transduction histidine kinase
MGSASNLRARLAWLAIAGILAGAGGVVMAALSNLDYDQRLLFIVLQTLTGWIWLGVGIFAWWRRPDNPYGKWLVITSFVWLGQFLAWSNSSLVFTAGLVVSNLFPVVLVETMVRFPTGRIDSGIDRWVMRTVIGVSVILMVSLLFSTSDTIGYENAPSNLLLVADVPTVTTVLYVIANAAAVVLTLTLIRSFIGKYTKASPPMRRLLGPVLWTSTVLLALLGISSLFSIATLDAPENIVGVLAAATAMILPLAFLIGLFRSRLIRGEALGRMLEKVAHENDPVRMQEAVAEALGDPSVGLNFWLPETRRFVDARGLPVTSPDPGSGQASSEVTIDGRLVALIVHDGALLEEPEKINAVSRGAALAFENARLGAEVRANVAELRASRARVVEAGDAARREIERNLHDGAQQNLVSLALKLQLARSRVDSDPRGAVEILDGASAELEKTLAELRELARGIHPAVLSDRGLDAALLALAHRAPLPVEVGELPEDRLPEPVEAAAYYVVAESLTNVVRYAGASRAKVDIDRADGIVRIRIADDGVGGADPSLGSGLKGLADRISSLDGSLQVQSPSGEGTVVEAKIPCG